MWRFHVAPSREHPFEIAAVIGASIILSTIIYFLMDAQNRAQFALMMDRQGLADAKER